MCKIQIENSNPEGLILTFGKKWQEMAKTSFFSTPPFSLIKN